MNFTDYIVRYLPDKDKLYLLYSWLTIVWQRNTYIIYFSVNFIIFKINKININIIKDKFMISKIIMTNT